jgi:hypothetical protein
MDSETLLQSATAFERLEDYPSQTIVWHRVSGGNYHGERSLLFDRTRIASEAFPASLDRFYFVASLTIPKRLSRETVWFPVCISH